MEGIGLCAEIRNGGYRSVLQFRVGKPDLLFKGYYDYYKRIDR